MTVWRICRGRHAGSAFEGHGARLFGGRWNRVGTPLAYASATLSIAVLELLFHLEVRDIPDGLVAVPSSIDGHIEIRALSVASLPRGWRSVPAPAALAAIGEDWVAAGKTPVLAVPSAIVPRERNYLINPRHPAFRRIGVGKPESFSLDPRLWQS